MKRLLLSPAPIINAVLLLLLLIVVAAAAVDAMKRLSLSQSDCVKGKMNVFAADLLDINPTTAASLTIKNVKNCQIFVGMTKAIGSNIIVDPMQLGKMPGGVVFENIENSTIAIRNCRVCFNFVFRGTMQLKYLHISGMEAVASSTNNPQLDVAGVQEYLDSATSLFLLNFRQLSNDSHIGELSITSCKFVPGADVVEASFISFSQRSRLSAGVVTISNNEFSTLSTANFNARDASKMYFFTIADTAVNVACNADSTCNTTSLAVDRMTIALNTMSMRVMSGDNRDESTTWRHFFLLWELESFNVTFALVVEANTVRSIIGTTTTSVAAPSTWFRQLAHLVFVSLVPKTTSLPRTDASLVLPRTFLVQRNDLRCSVTLGRQRGTNSFKDVLVQQQAALMDVSFGGRLLPASSDNNNEDDENNNNTIVTVARNILNVSANALSSPNSIIDFDPSLVGVRAVTFGMSSAGQKDAINFAPGFEISFNNVSVVISGFVCGAQCSNPLFIPRSCDIDAEFNERGTVAAASESATGFTFLHLSIAPVVAWNVSKNNFIVSYTLNSNTASTFVIPPKTAFIAVVDTRSPVPAVISPSRNRMSATENNVSATFSVRNGASVFFSVNFFTAHLTSEWVWAGGVRMIGSTSQLDLGNLLIADNTFTVIRPPSPVSSAVTGHLSVQAALVRIGPILASWPGFPYRFAFRSAVIARNKMLAALSTAPAGQNISVALMDVVSSLFLLPVSDDSASLLLLSGCSLHLDSAESDAAVLDSNDVPVDARSSIVQVDGLVIRAGAALTVGSVTDVLEISRCNVTVEVQSKVRSTSAAADNTTSGSIVVHLFRRSPLAELALFPVPFSSSHQAPALSATITMLLHRNTLDVRTWHVNHLPSSAAGGNGGGGGVVLSPGEKSSVAVYASLFRLDDYYISSLSGLGGFITVKNNSMLVQTSDSTCGITLAAFRNCSGIKFAVLDRNVMLVNNALPAGSSSDSAVQPLYCHPDLSMIRFAPNGGKASPQQQQQPGSGVYSSSENPHIALLLLALPLVATRTSMSSTDKSFDTRRRLQQSEFAILNLAATNNNFSFYSRRGFDTVEDIAVTATTGLVRIVTQINEKFQRGARPLLQPRYALVPDDLSFWRVWNIECAGNNVAFPSDVRGATEFRGVLSFWRAAPVNSGPADSFVLERVTVAANNIVINVTVSYSLSPGWQQKSSDPHQFRYVFPLLASLLAQPTPEATFTVTAIVCSNNTIHSASIAVVSQDNTINPNLNDIGYLSAVKLHGFEFVRRRQDQSSGPPPTSIEGIASSDTVRRLIVSNNNFAGGVTFKDGGMRSFHMVDVMLTKPRGEGGQLAAETDGPLVLTLQNNHATDIFFSGDAKQFHMIMFIAFSRLSTVTTGSEFVFLVVRNNNVSARMANTVTMVHFGTVSVEFRFFSVTGNAFATQSPREFLGVPRDAGAGAAAFAGQSVYFIFVSFKQQLGLNFTASTAPITIENNLLLFAEPECSSVVGNPYCFDTLPAGFVSAPVAVFDLRGLTPGSGSDGGATVYIRNNTLRVLSIEQLSVIQVPAYSVRRLVVSDNHVEIQLAKRASAITTVDPTPCAFREDKITFVDITQFSLSTPTPPPPPRISSDIIVTANNFWIRGASSCNTRIRAKLLEACFLAPEYMRAPPATTILVSQNAVRLQTQSGSDFALVENGDSVCDPSSSVNAALIPLVRQDVIAALGVNDNSVHVSGATLDHLRATVDPNLEASQVFDPEAASTSSARDSSSFRVSVLQSEAGSVFTVAGESSISRNRVVLDSVTGRTTATLFTGMNSSRYDAMVRALWDRFADGEGTVPANKYYKFRGGVTLDANQLTSMGTSAAATWTMVASGCPLLMGIADSRIPIDTIGGGNTNNFSFSMNVFRDEGAAASNFFFQRVDQQSTERLIIVASNAYVARNRFIAGPSTTSLSFRISTNGIDGSSKWSIEEERWLQHWFFECNKKMNQSEMVNDVLGLPNRTAEYTDCPKPTRSSTLSTSTSHSRTSTHSISSLTLSESRSEPSLSQTTAEGGGARQSLSQATASLSEFANTSTRELTQSRPLTLTRNATDTKTPPRSRSREPSRSRSAAHTETVNRGLSVTQHGTHSDSMALTETVHFPVAKTQLRQTTEALQSIAAVASILSLPSAAVAFGIGRQQSVQALLTGTVDAKCGFVYEEGPVPFAMSPLQLQIGPPGAGDSFRYRYVVGTVVGNVVLTLGLQLLFFSSGWLWRCFLNEMLPLTAIALLTHVSVAFQVFVSVLFGSTLYHGMMVFFLEYMDTGMLALCGCMGTVYLLWILWFLRKTLCDQQLWAATVFEYDDVDQVPGHQEAEAAATEEEKEKAEREERRKKRLEKQREAAEKEEQQRKQREEQLEQEKKEKKKEMASSLKQQEQPLLVLNLSDSDSYDELDDDDDDDDDDLPPPPRSPSQAAKADERTPSADAAVTTQQQQEFAINLIGDSDDDILGTPAAATAAKTTTTTVTTAIKSSGEQPVAAIAVEDATKPNDKKKNEQQQQQQYDNDDDDDLDLDKFIAKFVTKDMTRCQQCVLRFKQVSNYWTSDYGAWRYAKKSTLDQRLLFHFAVPLFESYLPTAPRFFFFELGLQLALALAVLVAQLVSPEQQCKAQAMISGMSMAAFLGVLLWLKPIQPRAAFFSVLLCVGLEVAVCVLAMIVTPGADWLQYLQVLLLIAQTTLAIIVFVWLANRIYQSVKTKRLVLSGKVNIATGTSDLEEKMVAGDARKVSTRRLLQKRLFSNAALSDGEGEEEEENQNGDNDDRDDGSARGKSTDMKGGNNNNNNNNNSIPAAKKLKKKPRNIVPRPEAPVTRLPDFLENVIEQEERFAEEMTMLPKSRDATGLLGIRSAAGEQNNNNNNATEMPSKQQQQRKQDECAAVVNIDLLTAFEDIDAALRQSAARLSRLSAAEDEAVRLEMERIDKLKRKALESYDV